MRPHRIQVSSSRWERLEEAEELDTSEEPLLRREPLIERMDLESASSNLRDETADEDEESQMTIDYLWRAGHDYKAQRVCLGRQNIMADSDIVGVKWRLLNKHADTLLW